MIPKNRRGGTVMKKKTFLRLAFLGLSVFGGWNLLCSVAARLIGNVPGGVSFDVTKAATIGVIGGADGPTAVFITAAPVPVWEILLWAVLLTAGILGFNRLKKEK
jgi:Na+-transporting methylmalonyl-CoA/oxaloacetate decarboxylase beta subunit